MEFRLIEIKARHKLTELLVIAFYFTGRVGISKTYAFIWIYIFSYMVHSHITYTYFDSF